MEPPPWLEDLADDLHSISFNSTTTTTATTDNRSTSSGSETTWTTIGTSSARHNLQIPSAETSESTGILTLNDIRFIHRLGAGDIGSVYLAKLKSSHNGVREVRRFMLILTLVQDIFLLVHFSSLVFRLWACFPLLSCNKLIIHKIIMKKGFITNKSN